MVILRNISYFKCLIEATILSMGDYSTIYDNQTIWLIGNTSKHNKFVKLLVQLKINVLQSTVETIRDFYFLLLLWVFYSCQRNFHEILVQPPSLTRPAASTSPHFRQTNITLAEHKILYWKEACLYSSWKW